MNPTDWTPEKPTTPGLYHWCDGVNKEVTVVSVAEACGSWYVSFVGHLPVEMERVGGYWQRYTAPAPFIKPVPPKVSMEIWEATAHDGSYRLLHVYQHGFIAFDYLGARKATSDMKASECGYTNLRRVDG